MGFDSELFSGLTIQAKLSYLEWIGRKTLSVVSRAARDVCLHGLNLIGEWREKQDVPGIELNRALMNERDEGIYAYSGSQEDEAGNQAIETIAGVVCYASWRAYKYEKAKYLPQEFELASDDYSAWIMEQFESIGISRSNEISIVLKYLLDRYGAGPEVLGEIVPLVELDNVAKT